MDKRRKICIIGLKSMYHVQTAFLSQGKEGGGGGFSPHVEYVLYTNFYAGALYAP